MAAMQSFDVTTGRDMQEVDHAVQQTLQEVTQRYDFKRTKVAIRLTRDSQQQPRAAPQ